MTFKQFETLLLSKKPAASVSSHDTCHGPNYRRVSIAFEPGGKLYSYTGSYGAILARFGIQTIEKNDVDFLRKRLGWYESPVDLGFGIFDNSKDIKEIESTLRDIETGKIILV